MTPHVTTEQLRAFFQHIKVTESGCWDWTGPRDPKGYGEFLSCPPGPMAPNKARPRAARVAWAWFRRDRLRPSPAWKLSQSCGRVFCVNPAHLRQKPQAVSPERQAFLNARKAQR